MQMPLFTMNVKKLKFTMPVLVNEEHGMFAVNIFHQEDDSKRYAVMSIITKPDLSIEILKNIDFKDDESVKQEYEMIKAYCVKRVERAGYEIKVVKEGVYSANMPIEATIEFDVKKFDEHGVEHTTHHTAKN